MSLFSRIASFADSLPKALENLSNAIRTAAERNRNDSDRNKPISVEVRLPENLESQRQSEQYKQRTTQYVIAAATSFAAVGAWFYAAIAMCQLQALKDQTTYAERAWVRASISIGGPMEYTNGIAHFTFDVTAENLGHAPASGVKIVPFMTSFVSPQYPSDQWEGQTYIDKLKKFRCPMPQTTSGHILLRGEHFSGSHEVPVGIGDWFNTSAGDALYPAIRFIVLYCIGFDNQIHTTVYDFAIRRIPDDVHRKSDEQLNRATSVFWADEGTVPKEQIGLYSSPMRSGYAD